MLLAGQGVQLVPADPVGARGDPVDAFARSARGPLVDQLEAPGRAQRGARPEKVKQEMAKDGSLENLYLQMREQKAIDALLENAQIEEVDLQPKATE